MVALVPKVIVDHTSLRQSLVSPKDDGSRLALDQERDTESQSILGRLVEQVKQGASVEMCDRIMQLCEVCD